MKLKFFLVVFTALIVLFSACTSDDAIYYGDDLSKDTLCICIDSSMESDDYELGKIVDELGQEIKNACGIERLTFEILPSEGAERKIAQTRLRTEIMSGGGPDIFIMQTVAVPSVTGVDKKAQFNFPEKSMEQGLFLPLDEYMKKNTRFTDWSSQTKAVLDAGRTDEGQVVIPMTYTFPVLVYPKKEVNIPYTTELTMWDVLKNSETTEIGTLLYSGITKVDENVEKIVWIDSKEISYLLGKFADFETDELLFTERELNDVLSTLIKCYNTATENPEKYMKHQFIKNHVSYGNLIYEVFNAYFEEDMALVPVYSKDGGVTASVRSFVAVNRNTHFPEQAFSVIDYIMQESSQRENVLYSKLFVDGIPLQNDLGSEEKTLEAASNTQRYLETSLYEDFLLIKDQITAVNYQNEIDAVLDELVMSSSQEKSFEDKKVAESYVAQAYEKMKRMMGE